MQGHPPPGATTVVTQATEPPATGPREATSLLGKPLYRPVLPPEKLQELEAKLAEARADYEAHPDDPERVIWLGRRLGYLGRYRDAIDVYSRGLRTWPQYAKLYRHRGHRYITVRQFQDAISDLERAARLIEGVPDEIEPDGMPNEYGIPTSTSHSNIWYHLGLAHYLRGDLEAARRAYDQCMRFSTNDDMLCATSHWLYMTYRRLGRRKEAERLLEPIRADMRILENRAYHALLLMYKGEKTPEALLEVAGGDLDVATLGYGVGNWYSYHGQREKAVQVFERVVQEAPWAAFGSIASEAELRRLQTSRR